MALNTIEQLEQVAHTLHDDPGIFLLELSPDLRRTLGPRKCG